ncbi:hypothetical protein MLD38_015919 [Melastoma candidum]|uniref:Uncharacterized protein n=1 Tax=Melastoma candidum TaxID=119954 RepID=A0ACB9RLD8_9MYRT|nr:hypothetical protein MLD38_015919 [Melastoma candidum]
MSPRASPSSSYNYDARTSERASYDVRGKVTRDPYAMVRDNGYFGTRSVSILVVIMISLLVLPSLLPPLAPPPAVLLLVPVLLMAFLVLLAFSPGQFPNASALAAAPPV